MEDAGESDAAAGEFAEENKAVPVVEELDARICRQRANNYPGALEEGQPATDILLATPRPSATMAG